MLPKLTEEPGAGGASGWAAGYTRRQATTGVKLCNVDFILEGMGVPE